MGINSFLAKVLTLYPLKTPENLWFSGVFRRYKVGALARNWIRSNESGVLENFVLTWH